MDEDEEINACTVIQRHLADGEYTLICEVGHEKLRYVGAAVTLITQKSVFSCDALSRTEEHLKEKAGISSLERRQV